MVDSLSPIVTLCLGLAAYAPIADKRVMIIDGETVITKSLFNELAGA